MLEIPDSGLMFPIISFAGKSPNARGDGQRALYTLGWREQEHELHQEASKDAKELSRFGLTMDTSGNLTGLPLQYDNLVWKTKFALHKDYAAEIHRMTLAANNEWAMSRSFDTTIREMCLNPAIEYIWCAFALLGDCVWDENNHYFDRSWLSIAMPYMLAYKFWRGQTGSGMVCEHAKIDKLKKLVERNSILTMPDERRAPIIDFLGAISVHEHYIDERGNAHNRTVEDVFEPNGSESPFDDLYHPVGDGDMPVDKES